MQTDGVVELIEEVGRELADDGADPFEGGACLVVAEPGRSQQRHGPLDDPPNGSRRHGPSLGRHAE